MDSGTNHKGKKATLSSELKGASLLAEHYRSEFSLDEKSSLPLVAFYPVERAIVKSSA